MAYLDSDLINNLYATIEQEECWITLLDQLKGRFHVESAVAQMLSAKEPYLQQLWTARDGQSQSRARLHDSWANSHANPRFRRPRRAISNPTIGSDFRDLTLGNTEQLNMRRGLASCGLGPGFWIDFRLDSETFFSLIFHRAPGDNRDVSSDEETWLGDLIPHLHRTLRLRHRLDDRDDMVRTLELASCATDTAMLVCDDNLLVKWANSPAKRLMHGNRHLNISNNMLLGRCLADTARLRTLVMESARGKDGVLALGTYGDDIQHLRSLPIRDNVPAGMGAEGFDRGHVLLLLSAPERLQLINPNRLGQVFGLTHAEAMLAAALSQGRSLSDFAAQRGITIGTARIQLKSIMAKTGTGRQADLVRLIASSSCARVPSGHNPKM